MAWTRWRLIADKTGYDLKDLDNEGPACYELAIGGPRGGNLVTVYVGETNNENSRMRQYGIHGSHLRDIIDRHINNGWCIFYRAQAKKSKKEAAKMQNRLLSTYYYCWNKRGILY